MSAIKPFLDKVGKYLVHRDIKPHSSDHVLVNAPRTAVLHTTEGGWGGSERVFDRHFAPHFMLGTVNGQPYIEQYVPVGLIASSMKASPSYPNNHMAIIQVECIGWSEEVSWQFKEPSFDLLASFMETVEAEYGVPLERAWPDGVYGRARSSDPHRYEGYFGTRSGWFGHGDVPANDHWDPGNLRWSELFERAQYLKARSLVA
jgi:hypothetical protein